MTLWTPPSLTAGSVLTSEKLGQITTQVQTLSDRECVLTADHGGVNNSTTLVNTNLSRAVAASKRYAAWGVLFYTAGTGEDFKPGISLPSGATVVRATLLSSPSTVNISSGDAFFGTNTTGLGFAAPGQTISADVMSCHYIVVFTTSTTAGNAVLQYAQGTAGAGTTTILRAASLWQVREIEGV